MRGMKVNSLALTKRYKPSFLRIAMLERTYVLNHYNSTTEHVFEIKWLYIDPLLNVCYFFRINLHKINHIWAGTFLQWKKLLIKNLIKNREIAILIARVTQ